MSAFKKAEERNSFTLRLFNPADYAVEGRISIFAKIKEAYLNNMNEERLEVLTVNSSNGVDIKAASNEILTIEFVI